MNGLQGEDIPPFSEPSRDDGIDVGLDKYLKPQSDTTDSTLCQEEISEGLQQREGN